MYCPRTAAPPVGAALPSRHWAAARAHAAADSVVSAGGRKLPRAGTHSTLRGRAEGAAAEVRSELYMLQCCAVAMLHVSKRVVAAYSGGGGGELCVGTCVCVCVSV